MINIKLNLNATFYILIVLTLMAITIFDPEMSWLTAAFYIMFMMIPSTLVLLIVNHFIKNIDRLVVGKQNIVKKMSSQTDIWKYIKYAYIGVPIILLANKFWIVGTICLVSVAMHQQCINRCRILLDMITTKSSSTTNS